MKPAVLFIISSDPRSSGRAAEAVRIAAGIAAWRGAAVAVCFDGEARRALAEWPEDLENGDHFARYLPALCEAKADLCVIEETLLASETGNLAAREIDIQELARLSAASDCLLRF